MVKKTNFVARFFIVEIFIVLAVIALDIFLKVYSEHNLQGQNIPLIKGIINLTYVENSGAAFGMLKGAQLFFKILTVIALGAFMYFLYKNKEGNLLFRISLALIIGGTAGNFIDRVKFNYVRDMLEFDFVDFAIFNVADSALTIGVTLFAVYFLFIYKEVPKSETAKSILAKTENSDVNGYDKQ